MQEIFNKISATVKKYHMLENGDRVVVGVSGGADSMLLLHWFLSVREEMRLTLTVAHMEHGIRGDASVADARFVEAFCVEKNVPFVMKRIDAPAEAKASGRGVEEYARQARYAFFESLPADKIATAHSRSDSAETVLFRIARGTGLKGATGIPAVRGNIIRPLIACSSDEIRAACGEMHIPFIVDTTNADNRYARNYIRNVIIPDFQRLNPALEDAVMRFSNAVGEADAFLTKAALPYVKDEIDVPSVSALDVALQKRVLSLYAERNGITLDEKHMNACLALLDAPGRYQLQGNIYVISGKKTLRFADLSESPAVNYIKHEQVVSCPVFLTNRQEYEKDFAFYCDYDKISGSVSVRTRLPQDKLTPVGRNCTKTLKKLMNELAVPVEARARIPIITDEMGIIGIYGYTVDNRVAFDEKTETVYLLNISEENR